MPHFVPHGWSDFDAELDRARPDQIEIHAGNPDAKLSTLGAIEADLSAGSVVVIEPSRIRVRPLPMAS